MRPSLKNLEIGEGRVTPEGHRVCVVVQDIANNMVSKSGVPYLRGSYTALHGPYIFAWITPTQQTQQVMAIYFPQYHQFPEPLSSNLSCAPLSAVSA